MLIAAGIEAEGSFVDPFCFCPGHQLVDPFRHENIVLFRPGHQLVDPFRHGNFVSFRPGHRLAIRLDMKIYATPPGDK